MWIGIIIGDGGKALDGAGGGGSGSGSKNNTQVKKGTKDVKNG